MALEEWRETTGYPGFEVSSLGRVRSWRPGRGPVKSRHLLRRADPIILKPYIHPNGYPYVGLSDATNRQKQRKVHHLVLEAFVGPRPDGMDGCHNNGVRVDARLENLRWDTRANNIADMRRHGTVCCGTKRRNAKLTESRIKEAAERYVAGESMSSIAREFGIGSGNLSRALAGLSWSHAERHDVAHVRLSIDNRPKLTAQDVRAIRAATGVSKASLARQHGVAPKSINKVLTGHSYAYVE